mgnify:FL=1
MDIRFAAIAVLCGLSACASSAVAEPEPTPAPIGPYSPSVRAGDLVFVSGQIGIDPETGEFAGPEIEDQAMQVLANIDRVLGAECSSLADVVEAKVFLLDMDWYGRFNETYASIMGETRPARAVVEVSRLPRDSLVEIMVTAYVPEGCE